MTQPTEDWRLLKPGDRVQVTCPISDMERALLGRTLTFVRFSNPHGYAVCADSHEDNGGWWLHPESLARVTAHDQED